MSDRRVFAIFQGGGAKGISHVGALGTLEEADVELVGVAGTSAGAIIASLASAGYSARELLDHESRSVVFEKLNVSKNADEFVAATGPRQLFGAASWFCLLATRYLSTRWKVFGALWLALWVGLAISWHLAWSWPLFGFWLFQTIGTAWALWHASHGMASLDRFVDGLNQILAQKVTPASGSWVTFGDLKAAKCIPLRIIASNVKSEEVRVFSAESSGEVPVAEAVAASACLPLIFKPRMIDGEPYFDGGLISNLPAWAFDEERSLDLDATTVTIEIVSSEEESASKIQGFKALLAAIRTGIFGTTNLDKRAVSNLHSIGLAPTVGLLDFDMSLEEAAGEITRAREDCELRLIYRLVELPQIMDGTCEILSEIALDLLEELSRKYSTPPYRERPRVAFLQRLPQSENTLKIHFSAGFRYHTDRGVSLPINSSLVGQAWEDGGSLLADETDPDWGATLSRPQDEGIKRLIAKSLCWVMAISYERNDAEEDRAVIAIDGSVSLGLPDVAKREFLEEMTIRAHIALDDLVPAEVFSDGF